MAKILTNIPLDGYNSFGVAAKADRIVEWESSDDLHDFLASDRDFLAGKWNIIGAGCNTLFSGDYRGTLLHSVSQGIEVTEDCSEWTKIKVAAGERWDDVVSWSIDRGLWGMENLSLIPSSIGAVPVQNIGAYGAEAKDCIESVEMIDIDTLSRVVLAGEYCSFGYRDSIFKHALRGRVIITAVIFRLSKHAAPRLGYGTLRCEVEKRGEATVENIREAVIAIRRSKLPDPAVTGNAGSFFKNPIVPREVAQRLKAEYPDMPVYDVADNESCCKLATGWMIENLGWKGYCGSHVGVHGSQALVLVNLGGATGREVTELADRISGDIKQRFGVEVSPEVNIL